MSSAVVTVAVAVFNGERYLEAMLSSVFRQSLKDWEMLIVDDGSSDGTAEILRNLRDSRVKVISHTKNFGLPHTRNELLHECQTPFLAWLDQDDLAGRRRLELQVQRLSEKPNVAVCGSWASRFGDLQTSFTNRVARTPITHEGISARTFFGSSPIVFSSATMNTLELRRLNLEFSPSNRNVLDYELWSHIAEQSKLENLPKILAHYRQHGAQTSRGAQSSVEMEQDILVVVGQVLKRRFGYSWSRTESELHGRLIFSPDTIMASELEEVIFWLTKLCHLNAEAGFSGKEAFALVCARAFLRTAISKVGLLHRSRDRTRVWEAARSLQLPAPVWGKAFFSGLRESL